MPATNIPADAALAAAAVPSANAPVCDNLIQTFNPIPYVNWGSMSTADQDTWVQNGCNAYQCQLWRICYKVDPFQSWGSLPKDNRKSWDNPNMSCNLHSGPFNARQCKVSTPAFAIVPFKAWGNAPEDTKKHWVDGKCYEGYQQ